MYEDADPVDFINTPHVLDCSLTIKVVAGVPAESYTVTFTDGQGNTLKTESVEKGSAATVPADPTKEGYTFDGWDKDFSSVTSDLTVNALWKENTSPAQPEPAVTTSSVEKGKVYSAGGQKYIVTVLPVVGQQGEVAFKVAKNAKNITVPSTIKLADGKTYKVTQINAKAFTNKRIRTVTISKNVKKIRKYAFKGSRAIKLIVKSKKLTKKASVKGSLKGSKIKTVQVKVGSRKANKTYAKKYKKIFTKSNAGRKVSVK